MIKYILVILLPLQMIAQDAQLEKFVDSILGPYNKPDVPGTMILVAQDGKPIFKKAYGMASLELGVPLKTSHAFNIGSVAKQFTAVALLQLAQQGKLKLTDDIRKYLLGYNSHGQVITIEHLISHTSGISSTERKDLRQFVAENGVSFHPNAFMPYVMKEPLLFPPGTNWSYNNISFMLAAIIVEKISGQKFADYLQQHIFQPAGMKDTYVANDLKPLNNVAASYTRKYDGKWRNDDRQNNWGWEKGAGGIISTLDDMLQWDIALRENKVLQQETLAKAWKPFQLKSGRSTKYGYGWGIQPINDLQIIYHGGAVNAYRNNSIHIPEKKLYVYYVNFYAADQYTIPKKIVGRLLNIPMPVPVKQTNQNISDYEGAYLLNYGGARISKQYADFPIYATFTTSGDTLFMRPPMGEKTFLRPAGKDRFLLPGSENNIYVFNRGADGKVRSMTIEAFLFGGAATEVENMKVPIQKKPAEKIVSIPAETLKKYTGTYYSALEDSYLFIELDGNRFWAHRVNAMPKFEMLPISNNKFIRKGVEEFKLSFGENKDGVMILTVSAFRDTDYRKIAD
jgi:CubicO group peptidase (beta-lactamase class C family)